MINANWLFGNKARLTFTTGGATASSSPWINTGEGCAAVSDSSGNLVFYTDGSKIWDGADNQQYGALLGNTSSTQSAIIVPDPFGAQLYYVFTADGASGNSNPFNGAHVDVTTWTVTPLGNLMTLPPNVGLSPTERVTAVQDADCQGFWVITVVQEGGDPLGGKPANQGTGRFRVFRVTATGVQWVGDSPVGAQVSDLGYLKPSPNGKRLALANWQLQNVLLFDFDNATGSITNLTTIPAPSGSPIPNGHPRSAYGLEFSPNSDVLYFTLLGGNQQGPGDHGYVVQVNLNPLSTPTVIIDHPNNTANTAGYSLGALQMGIDGRIYLAKDRETDLGAILDPNIVGMGCNPTISYVTLPTGSESRLGLPNLVPNLCPKAIPGTCDHVADEVDDLLRETCSRNVNHLLTCHEQSAPCPCTDDHGAGECQELDVPRVKPCFSVSWGDSDCDCIETDDVETLCITVCNCYSNVTFQNLTVGYVWVHDGSGGPVPTLPDGSPSVEVVPLGPICFGDVGPCRDGRPSCVSRQLVLVTRGAQGGRYQLELGSVCFSVSFDYQQSECFELELCRDR